MNKLKAASLSPNGAIILAAVFTLFAVPLRTFQFLNCMDPETGFWTVRDVTVPVLYAPVIAVAVFAFFISLFSGIMPKPEFSKQRDIPLGVSGLLMALGFAWDLQPGAEADHRLVRDFAYQFTVGLMGDSSVLQQMLTVTSLQILSDLICAIFAITATFFINWRLAIPLYILAFLFALNYKLNIGSLRRLARSQRSAEDRVASGVQNRLVANLTVKTYGTEEREGGEFQQQSALSLDLAREGQVASSTFWINTWLLRDVGYVVIFFLGCAMVLNGTANYGDVTAFLSYAMLLLWPAVRFSVLAQQLQNVKISAERLFEILDEQPAITNRPGARVVKKIRGQVTLDHVSFEYVPGKPVLNDISLEVEPGESVALVGPTGCGKSTVLSLLMRFYDVTGGAIRIDGIDIRDFDLASLRRHFGIVLQDSLLFTVSIADNIRYARPSASRRQVEFAARIAEIHNEILALPKGYDSVVGDRDVQLSVGQKQRLAIARAILAAPAILIMDEATSSLDTNSEQAIQVAMNRFLLGRTSFIVAHRLSTIRNASKIVLLDKGRIVECGSHDTLMELPGGRYRKLYETHAGAGIIKDEG